MTIYLAVKHNREAVAARVNSINADVLQLHGFQQSHHHFSVCSLNNRREEKEGGRGGGLMTVAGCLSQAREGGRRGALWLMPASDKMGLSVSLLLKIIAAAPLNTKLTR